MPSPAAIEAYEAQYPVRIGSHYEASIGLGGDLWGVIPLENGRLKVFSADFTGHGVGSALNTFRLHAFMTSGVKQPESPAEWLAQLNKLLCSVLSIGQFATMFCAVIDFTNGKVCHASAGVPPQLFKNAGTDGVFRLIDGTGYPLGLIENATYEEHCSAFPPGSGLVLYSDALVETPDPPREIFTSEGYAEFLNTKCADLDDRDIPAKTVSYLKEKAKQKLEDDLTLISIFHQSATRA